MFLQGQKGQNVEVIFWVKKVKRSRSCSENHENLLYLKHLLPIMYVSLKEMVLNTFKRHIIISINLASKKAPKLSEPYLRNRLRYRAIILHVKFFIGMYQHIQKGRKSKMVASQHPVILYGMTPIYSPES